MTTIQGNKRVTRLTSVYTREKGMRAIVVSLAAEGIYLRGQGLKTAWLIPYPIALLKAQQLAADVIRRERKEKKKTKKEGRV